MATATKRVRPKVSKRPTRASKSLSTSTNTGTTTKTPTKTITKTPKKKPTVSKSPKKTVTASTAPAKKLPPKKKTPIKKSPTKVETVDSGTSTTGGGRQMGEYGFVVGTDSALIAEALVEGGIDRNHVNELAEQKIGNTNGLKNRNGGEKYVPTMVSGVLTKMLNTGKYEIEAHWRLVPKEAPAKPAKKAVRARRTSK